MHALRIAALGAAGVVALTATGVRIGDHPAYVRVVVDFNGRVASRSVEFEKLTATTASVYVTRPGITTQTAGRSGQGVRVALQPGTQALHIAMSFARRRFKYVSYAVVTGNRLAIDLWKSAPPPAGRAFSYGHCLSITSWSARNGLVSVSGTERGVFENTFRVVVRGANGKVLGRRLIVHGSPWSTRVKYTSARRQTGTIEAASFSPKDGSLACLYEVRGSLPPS